MGGYFLLLHVLFNKIYSVRKEHIVPDNINKMNSPYKSLQQNIWNNLVILSGKTRSVSGFWLWFVFHPLSVKIKEADISKLS